MSTRKSTVFYGVLIALASLVVGMVIASRLDLTPSSLAGTLNVPATNSAPLSGPVDAATFRNIAQASSPTVVSIIVRGTRPSRGVDDLFGFQNPFGGRGGQRQQEVPVQGAGSGFIIDKTGYILTNNHVIEDAIDIDVWLSSMDPGEPGLPAKVVGRDVLTDTALLQLTATPREPLVESKFGDSSQIAPGDWVMAIGNPYQLSNTVTVGVVSAVGRLQPTSAVGRYEQMIQTDAAINRGNSGGPLLNIRGEVVGINTMIVSDQSGGNLGIGFAVPINSVRDILPQLRAGKVIRGRIGISVSRAAITSEDAEDMGLPRAGGAVVSRVDEGTPAKAAGMRVEDVIIEFNGKPVKNSDELVSMVTHTAPGTTVPVKVVRDKKTITLNVRVEELDIDQEQTVASADRPRGGRNAPRDTGFGMTIEGVTPEAVRQLRIPAGRGGAIVSDVDPASPALQAGLRPGDVIFSVNGQEASSVDQVSAALDRVAPGRQARLRVWREGREELVQIRKR